MSRQPTTQLSQPSPTVPRDMSPLVTHNRPYHLAHGWVHHLSHGWGSRSPVPRVRPTRRLEHSAPNQAGAALTGRRPSTGHHAGRRPSTGHSAHASLLTSSPRRARRRVGGRSHCRASCHLARGGARLSRRRQASSPPPTHSTPCGRPLVLLRGPPPRTVECANQESLNPAAVSRRRNSASAQRRCARRTRATLRGAVTVPWAWPLYLLPISL